MTMEDAKKGMIIFDIDGTLAETDDFILDKINCAAAKVFPFIPQERREHFNRKLVNIGETIVHTGYRILDIFGLDPVLSRAHEKMSGEEEYKYGAVAEMKQTLDTLKGSYHLSVVTSGGRKSTEAFLRKFELEEMFDVVITAQDCRHIKPSPEPINTIIERTGCDRNACWMVGDTFFDVLSARRAGIRSVSVRTGFDGDRILRLFRADIIIDSVSDLPKVLP